jgi:hypothetical protein
VLNKRELNNLTENDITDMKEINLNEIENLEETITPALGGVCGIGCGGAVCGLWC